LCRNIYHFLGRTGVLLQQNGAWMEAMFTESHGNRQSQACERVGVTCLLTACYESDCERNLSYEPPRLSRGRLVRELRRGLTAGSEWENSLPSR
jgi:hypothetical protein